MTRWCAWRRISLRYPLIDGQGNFGSRDGDNAAAMRYTEARLTPIAKLLLDELDEGTVDFVPNYDGSQEEPQMLPARLPVMLLNGASGIAVGMATEIPPHNLREVAQACVTLIKQPQLTDAELYSLVPGPDFAGGGQIITPAADIAQIYSTGRGSLKVRARWQFEEMARGQWQLVVTELPPGTSCQKVLEEIEEITNPKVKTGKKSLTPEQTQSKAVMLNLLDAVRDESGKDAAVRLVFEPKTSRVDRDEFVNTLLAQTSMESSASVNLVCIGTDGRPRQKGLRDILTEWLAFRTQTVTRRTRFRLDKVIDRIHVLEGRMVVYLNVDEVIQTIRESDEPRAALMERFKLTERQADDILEMRLRQLARLEGIKIEQELAGKREEQVRLQELLDNPASLKRLLVKEIEADAKQYGDDRRTLIETAERAVLETKVLDEPVTVIVSQKGWLRARQGHGHDASQFGFKQGDDLYGAFECRTTDTLIAVGDNGRVYSVAVSGLPSARGDGQPITTMIDLESGSRIVHMIAAAADSRWLLATRGGYGFAAKLGHVQPPACRQAVHHAGSRRRAAAAGAAVRRRDAAGAAVGQGQVPGVRPGRGQESVGRRPRHDPDGAGHRRQAGPGRADRRGRADAPRACTATSTPRTSWPARRSRPTWASARARAGSWTCARSSRCCRRCWAERPGAPGTRPIPRHAGAGFFWEASWRSRSGAPAAPRGRGRRDPFVDEAARLGFN